VTLTHLNKLQGYF